jgi:hypothetical protein
MHKACEIDYYILTKEKNKAKQILQDYHFNSRKEEINQL